MERSRVLRMSTILATVFSVSLASVSAWLSLVSIIGYADESTIDSYLQIFLPVSLMFATGTIFSWIGILKNKMAISFISACFFTIGAFCSFGIMSFSVVIAALAFTGVAFQLRINKNIEKKEN